MKFHQFVYLLFCSGFLSLSSCNSQPGPQQNPNVINYPEVEKPVVYEDITEQEVLDFVETWRNLYTTHTFDNYIKLYDRRQFKGIKRTYTGERNVYDYREWRRNKMNEFRKYSPEIMVENVKVKDLNRNGRSKVSFIQVWISYSTSYADKGEKILILKKINGEIFIEREELLYSIPADEYFGT